MKTTIGDAYIRFLPSPFGTGFLGTFRHCQTERQWHERYGHLRGWAEYPHTFANLIQEGAQRFPAHRRSADLTLAWLHSCVTRLQQQGVTFEVSIHRRLT